MTAARARAQGGSFFALRQLGLEMDLARDNIPLLVAAGLDFEARVAEGPGFAVIYGQNRRKYREDLHAYAKNGVRGLISFGIAGGLSPSLKPGDVVVANTVLTVGGAFAASRQWTKALLHALPGACHMPIFGAEVPIMTALEKEALWSATGAVAVDMESGPVAQVAAHYGLPFAVLRVVLDPAHRTIPISALAAAREDGTTDVKAALKALLKRPRDLNGLLRLARDSRKANLALLKSRQALAPLLNLLERETGELALNME